MNHFDGADEIRKAVVVLAIAGIYTLGGKILQLAAEVGDTIVKDLAHRAKVKGETLAIRRELGLGAYRQEARALGVNPDLVSEGWNALVVRQEVTVDEIFRFVTAQMNISSN